MYLTDKRLHNIVRESIGKLLLSESQESKSRHAAKQRIMKRFNCDEQKADETLQELKNTISSLKQGKCGRFIEGVARMYCDGQLRDTNTMSKLNATLKYVASDAHINEYNRNLNEISAQDLIDRFAANIEADLENDINKLDQKHYTGSSEYDIVRIDSFEQAKEYYEYTFPDSRWCLTYMEDMFEKYTCGGINQIYFCLKKGFENIEPVVGEGCPLDEYGLSMLSVIVNENGALVHCTSRWNHKNGGSDNVMNTEQISDVIQMGFYKVFKPNTKWKDTLENAIRRLANGESPEDVFGAVDSFHNGCARVRLENKWNFINQSGELLSPNQWFDYCDWFRNGFGMVERNRKYNYINQNGQLLTELPTASESIKGKWFDGCYDFKNGLARVESDGKRNFINQNGELLTELPTANELIKGEWFDYAEGVFVDGFMKIEVNDKWNYINRDGELLYKKPIDQWFDYCNSFTNGFAKVESDDKMYYIDTQGNEYTLEEYNNILKDELELKKYSTLKELREDFVGNIDVTNGGENFFKVVVFGTFYNFSSMKDGKFLSDEWFDACSLFFNGFAKIKLNGKYNFIKPNGEVLWKKPNNEWLDECYSFCGGFAIIKLNGKWNYINQYGGLLSPDQWFDNCNSFENGYARVKINGEYYYIDTYGDITRDKAQVTESLIRNIIRECVMDFIKDDR